MSRCMTPQRVTAPALPAQTCAPSADSIAAELATRFGTGQAQGEMLDREADCSVFPDGTSVVVCTNWAAQVVRELGAGRATVYGFYGADNPTAKMLDIQDGHDFAVVDGRYIVDGWAFDVAAVTGQPVFDMLDPEDAVKVAQLYGDRSKWVETLQMDDDKQMNGRGD